MACLLTFRSRCVTKASHQQQHWKTRIDQSITISEEKNKQTKETLSCVQFEVESSAALHSTDHRLSTCAEAVRPPVRRQGGDPCSGHQQGLCHPRLGLHLYLDTPQQEGRERQTVPSHSLRPAGTPGVSEASVLFAV